MSYDEKSTDAVFSKILTVLEAQNRQLDRIEEQAKKTNGRVSSLELWRSDIKARIAVMALIASGVGTSLVLLFEHYLYR